MVMKKKKFKERLKKMLFRDIKFETKNLSDEELSEYKKQYIESGKDVIKIFENKGTLWLAIILLTMAIVFEILEYNSIQSVLRKAINNKRQDQFTWGGSVRSAITRWLRIILIAISYLLIAIYIFNVVNEYN
ncbi:hypothetical protein FACS189426_16210 [Bacteroidia bacterium]|nr:hypothetical protein FACS189426_16210 [Bacteroidia bacterium]